MGQKRQPKRQPKKAESFPYVWAILIAALAFGAYVGTLGHGFILDDASLISQSNPVRQVDLRAIVEWGAYRPVRTLTYALNYALGGQNPFGYHLFNVLLHALNAFLVFLLFHRWRLSRLVAVVAAAIFAIHPAQTAAVAYISGRKDELAALFVVAACLTFTAYLRRRAASMMILTFVFCVLAVLAKEVAVVFPALALLIDVLIVGRESSDSEEPSRRSLVGEVIATARRSPLFYGICAALVVGGAYYSVFVIEASRAKGFLGGSLSTHYGTVFKLLVHYVKLALVAYPLIADYTGKVFKLSSGFTDPATLVSVLFAIAYVAVAFKIRRWNPIGAFGMLWFLICLLPVLQIMPFHELAADHYLYLALVGPVLIVGDATAFAARRWGTKPAVGAAAALALVCLIATIHRNRDWKDEYTLWSETYRVAPGAYRANLNLGNYYYGAGDIDAAISFTERATQVDSSREQAWSNLGGLYKAKSVQARERREYSTAEALGRRALDCLTRAINMEPKDVWAYLNLGQTYRELALTMEAQGRVTEVTQMRKKSFEAYYAARKIGSENPFFPLVWSETGKLFMDAGYYDQAAEYFDQALKAFPDRVDVMYSLGVCYFNLRDYPRTIEYLERVVQLKPDSPVTVWGMLAKSYEEQGDNRGAIQVYERARSRYPSSVDILYNLGVLYHRVGDSDTAIARLELALKLAPDSPLTGNISRMLAVMKEELE